MKPPRLIPLLVRLEPEEAAKLRRLAAETRLTQAVLLRDAVRLVLEAYEDEA